MVVGLGGVGSHAAAALARSGVGRLRLVDFDKLTCSGLNRHAMASPAQVGRGKGEVVAEHLRSLDPALVVEVAETFVHADTVGQVLAGEPDFVIDAIDSFGPKVELLRYCVENGLRVVSCMGASARTNPTLLRIGEIDETRVCPLARVVRRGLRKYGINRGITAVYSVEAPLDPLPPDEEEQLLDRGRIRNRLPSLGYMPGIFGYAAAGIVITAMAHYPLGSAR